jgi:hypothetical protein
VLQCFFVLVLENAPFVKHNETKNYHNSRASLLGFTFLQPAALSSKTSVKNLVKHKTRHKILNRAKSLPNDCHPSEMTNKL